MVMHSRTAVPAIVSENVMTPYARGPAQLYESRHRKGTVEQAAARERARQVAQVQRAQKLEDQCLYCKSSEWHSA